jgi:sn-glycerol 3-phosphate transport system substrate-binding protein
MNMKFISSITGLLLAASVLVLPAAWAQTEVQWWHAMSGVNGHLIDKMANDFNPSQSE